jgi:hypothetical protein
MRVCVAMGACMWAILFVLAQSFARSVVRPTHGGVPPSRTAPICAPHGVNVCAYGPSAFNKLAGPFSTRPSLAVSR